ncbi:TDT family transporter [Streptococcus phocae]|uniref:C4-dicarboxylate ABC transporter n=1 Tax=Streptococcus phocae TaxID=119224 RepID=A0A0P6SMN7_9STRE|nr:TDT family transporter [Streptococcus phocae]KPJ22743.1 C4-dicarboxylate ABC transporter [Streptococcus phocae]
MKQVKHPPLVISGLVLGTLSLGNLLGHYVLPLKYLLTIAAVALYALLIVSIIRAPPRAKTQLAHPLIASVFPTFFMTGMLLSSWVMATRWSAFGRLFWWFFLLGNFCLIIYYVFRFVWRFSWENVFPSWSVLFIGIAVGALTAPASRQFILGQFIFWICLVMTGLILPFMAKKAYLIGLDEAVKPNISTFCAPMSLLSAAYLASFPLPSRSMVIFLMIASQLLYFFVLIQLPILLKRPFNPGFAAFTFPFVISATSLKMNLAYLGLAPWWQYLLFFEVLVASLLVTYVYSHYIRFLMSDA